MTAAGCVMPCTSICLRLLELPLCFGTAATQAALGQRSRGVFFMCCCPTLSNCCLRWEVTDVPQPLVGVHIQASLLNPRVPFTILKYTVRRRPRATLQSIQCRICLYCHIFFFLSYCISYLLIVTIYANFTSAGHKYSSFLCLSCFH